MTENSAKNNNKQSKQSFWQVVLSTCAAAFGVQSAKKHEQDFSEGSVKTYIIAGIVFTLIFILMLVAAVKLVLGNL